MQFTFIKDLNIGYLKFNDRRTKEKVLSKEIHNDIILDTQNNVLIGIEFLSFQALPKSLQEIVSKSSSNEITFELTEE